MSFAQLHSYALSGIAALPVTVEVHLANGLPAFNIVGLPEGAVRESRERVRSALQTAGFDMPARRITVNLAPANLPKSGTRFDLPIALGILLASAQLPTDPFAGTAWVGELGLNGEVRPVEGVLPTALAATEDGVRLGVPLANLDELSLLPDMSAMGVDHLLSLVAWAQGEGALREATPAPIDTPPSATVDWADVKGQLQAKRALEVAAAGGHNAMLVGPPGCGKSMLAARLPTILPPLSLQEAREVGAIWSVSGTPRTAGTFFARPWQVAEPGISTAGLVGGGVPIRPGALSRAHAGVLFLDEVTEFRRDALEALRAPLESGQVHIARAREQVVFPARPLVTVLAANPSPSGYFPGDARCTDTPDQIRRYFAKLSGPLLDRIDIHMTLQPVEPEALQQALPQETSAEVRARVAAAWARQQDRQGCLNGQLQGRRLEEVVQLDAAQQALLRRAMETFNLSARSYHRILRLARTLADLAGVEQVETAHLQEAIGYRRAWSAG